VDQQQALDQQGRGGQLAALVGEAQHTKTAAPLLLLLLLPRLQSR
jgi:hypothetical protein